MTPADSRVWKADGEISRSEKSETHHLPKDQGESQARGQKPYEAKGSRMEAAATLEGGLETAWDC